MEYPKIETLYVRDEATHRLAQPLTLKNRTYGLLKSWQITEKIDGTNVRCIWQDGQLSFRGRTDKSELPAELIKRLSAIVLTERLQSVFPDTGCVLYGEGYGPGIQKGGGEYGAAKDFILYDILVDGGWWLIWENTCEVAAKLGLLAVPYLGEMSLEAVTDLVRAGFPSGLNAGKRRAEGIVGRPAETLFDKNGARLILKLKTRDF